MSPTTSPSPSAPSGARPGDGRVRGVVAAMDAWCATSVLATARQLAVVLDLPVVGVHVDDGRGVPAAVEHADRSGAEVVVLPGDPVAVLRELACDDAVEVLVLGTRGLDADRRPLGSVTDVVVRGRCPTPLLVVPPCDRPVDRPLRRVLAPLDVDDRETAVAVRMLDRLRRGGCDVVGLHVFDLASVPAFLDHPGHGTTSWRSEFARRHDVEHLELRRGSPGRRIVEAAHELKVDLVVLAWSGVLDDRHGHVVAQVLAGVEVPVMLLPARAGTSQEARA